MSWFHTRSVCEVLVIVGFSYIMAMQALGFEDVNRWRQCFGARLSLLFVVVYQCPN
jgi:hypothetical protein